MRILHTYNLASRFLLFAVAVILTTSCQQQDDGHSHVHDSFPRADTTLWTDNLELFVEYPVLVVGKRSRFAAHFTSMREHKPVDAGILTVSLLKSGAGIRSKVDAPSSPGIFTPELQPKEEGIYRLVFSLTRSTYIEEIVLENIRVYATEEDAIKNAAEKIESGGEIPFLKEQAWKIDFQTLPVVQKNIHDVITTSGVWKVSPTGHKTMVATTGGIVSLRTDFISDGARVKKGQVLMTLTSASLTNNNITAEIRKARADLDQVESEYQRFKQLFESGVIAKAEFEQIEQKMEIADANYSALSAGYSGEGKDIAAPFDGYIKELKISNGSFVEQGDELLSVVNKESSVLEIYVSPTNTLHANDIVNIWYQPAIGEWSSLSETKGSVISVGRQVDRDDPQIAIYANVKDAVRMPEGSFTEVQVAVGNATNSLVVPESALLDNYGYYSVIVQLGGESFERREVVVGKRNGSEVEIINGLKPGDRIVSRGAYQVMMASMSGQIPDHGHSH